MPSRYDLIFQCCSVVARAQNIQRVDGVKDVPAQATAVLAKSVRLKAEEVYEGFIGHISLLLPSRNAELCTDIAIY